MKIFKLIFIVIVLTSLSTYAQDLKKGDYVPNANNKKFLGTWIYVKNRDTLKIVFEEKKKVLLDRVGVYTDIVEGKISLIKNGKTQIVSANNQFIIDKGMASKNEPNRMDAFLLDPTGKSAPIKFELLQNGKLLKYQVEQTEGVRTKNQKDNKVLRIPRTLSLEKL